MNDKIWRSYSYPELLFVLSNLFENCLGRMKNSPDKMKRASSGESGTGEEPKPFSVANEVESLRRAFAEKERRELFQQSSRLVEEIEPELLETHVSEFEVLECEGENSAVDMDVQALGYKDSEFYGNSSEEDETKVPDCVEMAVSKDQFPTAINENVIKQIFLSPEKAEEILLLLETMSIRLVQNESKFFGKLKKDIAGAQHNIDQARKILGNLPPFTSEESRTEFILEVGQYIESIFCCLEDLSRKLVECHAREMNDVVGDLKEGLESVDTLDKSPESESSVKKAVLSNNVSIMEFTSVAVATVLICVIMFLLVDPVVTGAIGEFYACATQF